jgi:hypothetical protein
MKHRFLATVCCLILLAGCGGRLTKMSATKRAERMATERGRLSELTDPVERTKSYIVISDVLLSFASDAVRDGTIEELGVLMDQYVTAIRAARDTMTASKRDPERKPQGYRDLELALRGQTRSLRDLGGQLLVDQRESLDRAAATASSIREELLQLLFPQQKPRVL